MYRKILLAALVVAPLAWSPATASAQERGTARASAASANAQATNRPTELPAGMANRPAGQALPAGIAMTRTPAPAPAPVTPPETEPEPETCPVEAVFTPTGVQFVDCHGNIVNPSED